MKKNNNLILNKLYKLDQKNKMFIIFSLFSFLLLIISLFWLIWNPFILYGTIYGMLSLYLSFGLILLFKNKKISRIYGIIIYSIRISIFLLFFLFGILLINPFFAEEKGVKLFLRPINLISFFITNFLYVISIYFLPLYDYILKILINKNIKYNKK